MWEYTSVSGLKILEVLAQYTLMIKEEGIKNTLLSLKLGSQYADLRIASKDVA
jgi:hypothetical protein